MSSLVKSRNRSFLRKQESRKTNEKTGFPLKNCGNDGNISNVALLLNSLDNNEIIALILIVAALGNHCSNNEQPCGRDRRVSKISPPLTGGDEGEGAQLVSITPTLTLPRQGGG
jgi:hypothetical protein